MEYVTHLMRAAKLSDESWLQGCPEVYSSGQSRRKEALYKAQQGREGIVTFETVETEPPTQPYHRMCVYENSAFLMGNIFYGDEPDGVEVMDLENNGADEIFFHVHMPGGSSGNHDEGLYVVRPSARWMVSLELVFGGPQYAVIPTPQYSEDYFSPENSAAVRFLDLRKWDYGYIDDTYVEANADNPAFAAYLWMKDNDSVEDGPVRTREYQDEKGELYCEDAEEGPDVVKDGDYTYLAVFKGPVVACNNKTRRFFVAFHPHTSSDVTVIKKSGTYLLVGMRAGEGLAVLNLETRHLKRYAVKEPNIERITLENGVVRLNGGEALSFPTF